VTLPAAWDTQFVRRVLDNLDKLKFIMPAMFGFIVALLFHDSWFEFLSYFNAVPFGHSDPIFHKDVSFYLFAIPASITYAMRRSHCCLSLFCSS